MKFAFFKKFAERMAQDPNMIRTGERLAQVTSLVVQAGIFTAVATNRSLIGPATQYSPKLSPRSPK